MLREICRLYSQRGTLERKVPTSCLRFIKCKGSGNDYSLQKFQKEWIDMYRRLRTVPTGESLLEIRDIYEFEVRKTKGLQYIMSLYDERWNQEGGQTYEWLFQQVENYLARVHDRGIKNALENAVMDGWMNRGSKTRDRNNNSRAVDAAPGIPTRGRSRKDQGSNNKDSHSSGHRKKGSDGRAPRTPSRNRRGDRSRGRSSSTARTRSRSRTPSFRGRSGSRDPKRRRDRSRSRPKGAPAAPAVTSGAPNKSPNKQRTSSNEKKSKLPCYAFSRSCCPHGDKCKKAHRPLTAEEIKKRDEQEESFK